MRQPALGLVAGTGIIAVSLAVISLFSWTAFSGWVVYALMCTTPTAIIVGTLWPPSRPALPQVSQPARGLALLVIAATIAAGSAGLGLLLVGHSASSPSPSVSQFAVDSIPVTFWLCVIYEGWPFVRLRSREARATCLIIASYALNYGLYALLVLTGWIAGATLDAVAVSAVAVMFLMLQFELWPLSGLGVMSDQPRRGMIWTFVVIVAGIILVLIGTGLLGTPATVYMARAPIPFIFGCILTLNTLQGSLVTRFTQPLRGICGALVAAGAGYVLAVVYRALTETLTGHLTSFPPTYQRATWLASALLGVTFLFLSLHKDFFEFWPLPGAEPEKQGA